MPGFFDVDERLKRLSELGDQLEAYAGLSGISCAGGVKKLRPPWPL
ncbi:hypothetical protein EV666_10314 [Camelimonas lactis]|uniref:Uncharacterized protein n=1 Tax=Camelimonas lactis TaxID=659006 RepID=A0A4R2GUP2_9HYPH|nr:hypothetical protein EV666_10314 [Camelimonas lactis]